MSNLQRSKILLQLKAGGDKYSKLVLEIINRHNYYDTTFTKYREVDDLKIAEALYGLIPEEYR